MKKCLYCTVELLVVFLLVACTPSASQIQTAVGQTQAAIPTNTISPTYTPKNVPTSTNTPVPIPAASPTPTRPPTPTSRPTPTTDVSAYRTEIINILSDCSDTIDRFKKLNTEVADNPNVIRSVSWRTRAEYLTGMMLICAISLQEKRFPPAEYAETDGYLVKAGQELQAMVDDYDKGIADRDTSYFTLALDHLNSFNGYFEKANQALPGA